MAHPEDRLVIEAEENPSTFVEMRELIAAGEASGRPHMLVISAEPVEDGVAVTVVGNAHPNNIQHFMIPELERIVERAFAAVAPTTAA